MRLRIFYVGFSFKIWTRSYGNRNEQAKECYKAAECYAAESQRQSEMKESKQ